jgi:hypothetical protein
MGNNRVRRSKVVDKTDKKGMVIQRISKISKLAISRAKVKKAMVKAIRQAESKSNNGQPNPVRTTKRKTAMQWNAFSNR